MTEEEAYALIERIAREAPPVRATFDATHKNAVGNGYRVQLRLCQRSVSVAHPADWPSIRQAWQWFLPESGEKK